MSINSSFECLSWEVERKTKAEDMSHLAHSVENIIAEVTFQFWAILDNYWQFWTIFGNFCTYFCIFGNFWTC